MSIREIAQIGTPILSTKCQTVPQEDITQSHIQSIIDDLIDTMEHANGAGIAANQIFEDYQICVIRVKEGNPRYPYKPAIPLTILINPVIKNLSAQSFINFEGCLSVPNMRAKVKRHAHVQVSSFDRAGLPQIHNVKGITAGTFQHEIDHLNGSLFIQKVHDVTSICTWDNFKEYFEADFIKDVEAIVTKYGS